MTIVKQRSSLEEIARQGDAIYENSIRPLMSSDDEGRFAAIDIATGEYEKDTDELMACSRLRSKHPDAEIWLVRIGSRYVHRFG